MDLKHLQRNWDELGREDPLWAILTAPGKRGGGWQVEEFFATGAREVEALMGYLASLGLAVGKRKALDFGCGVGRLTQALAGYFHEVWGVDIAPSMIALADRHNRQGGKCRYYVNDRQDLAFLPDQGFDLVCSLLTLQHIPPRYAKNYLREFLRVLAPGGVLVFQMAGEPISVRKGAIRALRRAVRRFMPECLLRSYRKLRYGHLIDMYGMPREEMARFLEENGGRLVDVREDTSAGGGWTSFRYCVAKE